MVWIHVLWNLYQYLWDYPISFIPQLAQGDKSRSNLKHWGGVKNHMVSTVLLDIVGNPIVHKLIVWGLFLGMVYYWVYQIKELLKSSRSYSCLSPMAKLSSCNCAVTFFAWRSQGGCMGLRAWPDAVWILWIVAKIMFNWFNPFSRLFFFSMMNLSENGMTLILRRRTSWLNPPWPFLHVDNQCAVQMGWYMLKSQIEKWSRLSM